MAGRRSGSKKHKSSWRKTDILDIEKFLEDERTNQRIESVKSKVSEFKIDKNPHLSKASKSWDSLDFNDKIVNKKNELSSIDTLSNYLDQYSEPKKLKYRKEVQKPKILLRDIWSKKTKKSCRSTEKKLIINAPMSEIPKSSLSYHPKLSQYYDHLSECSKNEEKVLRIEKRRSNATGPKPDHKYTAEQLKSLRMNELMSGLPFGPKEDEVNQDELSEEDCILPAKLSKKPRDKSGKAKRKKIAKANRKQQNLMKEKENLFLETVDNVKGIVASVEMDEKRRMNTLKLRKPKISKSLRVFRSKKAHNALSEIPLPTDLTSTLRLIKPSHSLFKDYALHLDCNRIVKNSLLN